MKNVSCVARYVKFFVEMVTKFSILVDIYIYYGNIPFLGAKAGNTILKCDILLKGFIFTKGMHITVPLIYTVTYIDKI